MESRQGLKKHCACVHIKEMIIAGGTTKKYSVFKIRSCSYERETFSEKFAPSNLRAFIISKCPLVEVSL